jgi:hypothetical protein
MAIVMDDLKVWCGCPNVHVPLMARTSQLLNMFYSLKTTIITNQAGIIWWHKRFIDVFVGFSRSVNDSKVPYLLGDKCYPLII